MSLTSHDIYLSNQVLTASPYKLRLMLIDGALRFGQAARAHWEAGETSQAEEAIGRCRKIVAELLRSAVSCEDRLAQNIAGVFSFLMRSLTEAILLREVSKLDDVIRVLRVEKETWQAVCDRFGNAREPSSADAFLESDTPAEHPAAPPLAPRISPNISPDALAADGFSWEA